MVLLGFGFPEWMTSYLADFLCVPFVLGISRAFLRIVKTEKHYFLSYGQAFYVFLLFGLLFEWILPSRSPSYRADSLDVLMYANGAFIFLLLQRMEQGKVQRMAHHCSKVNETRIHE